MTKHLMGKSPEEIREIRRQLKEIGLRGIVSKEGKINWGVLVIRVGAMVAKYFLADKVRGFFRRLFGKKEPGDQGPGPGAT